MEKRINVIGAGLAGCEAALQISARGVPVRLFDIKPKYFTPAHSNPDFCELVCSNSLKSDLLSTAGGMLKAELRLMKSRVLEAADSSSVPAGSALAVDRAVFAKKVDSAVKADPLIEIVCEEVKRIPEGDVTIVATGPLTTDALAADISSKFGQNLHFYDAEAPIISGDSIDYSETFTADRYGKGESDYVNCPLTKEEYERFIKELVSAECAERKEFEKSDVFEGCMPVEIMAKRGEDTLRFGPLRPVGFRDSAGNRPYAVVQLRRENAAGSAYNIVGFQTNLKFGEQKRVFSLIPALKNADYLRYGVMHRNSFVNAPKTLNKGFMTKLSGVFIAGQLSGVEGYVESVASGLIAGVNAVRYVKDIPLLELPPTTITGALCDYLVRENADFQPMNANFGILPPLNAKIRDKNAKKLAYSERGLKDLKEYINTGTEDLWK